MPTLVPNPLCSCSVGATCESCQFCESRNTQQGRKALCEKITNYLVLQPIYQSALAQAMYTFFPDKIVYDDEKDICTMLFEAVLFEDNSTGPTPLSYFIDNAPLSRDEKRFYEAWRKYTRYEFFAVEKVTPDREIVLNDLSGERLYRVHEHRGTATMKAGSIIIARIVPFLKGWMFTTECIISYAGDGIRERLRTAYGEAIPQFLFVRKHLENYRKRMTSV